MSIIGKSVSVPFMSPLGCPFTYTGQAGWDGESRHTLKLITSGTLTFGETLHAEVFMVGGGGGGGREYPVRVGGGGGGGGYTKQFDFVFAKDTPYAVTVGAGGAENENGGDTVLGEFTALGGRCGGKPAVTETEIACGRGGSGGSGGGGGMVNCCELHSGGSDGEKGEAGTGSVSDIPVKAGAGGMSQGLSTRVFSFWPEPLVSGGGGGGNLYAMSVEKPGPMLTVGAPGGAGGGGSGALYGIEADVLAKNGEDGTGGGGGGGVLNLRGGKGGSGVVLIRRAD